MFFISGYAPFPTQSSPVKTAPSVESNQKSPAPAGMGAVKPAAAPEQTTQQHTTPQQSPSNASQKARPCEWWFLLCGLSQHDFQFVFSYNFSSLL